MNRQIGAKCGMRCLNIHGTHVMPVYFGPLSICIFTGCLNIHEPHMTALLFLPTQYMYVYKVSQYTWDPCNCPITSALRCKLSHPEFELVSPCSFPTTITILLRAPPYICILRIFFHSCTLTNRLIYIYIYIYIYISRLLLSYYPWKIL